MCFFPLLPYAMHICRRNQNAVKTTQLGFRRMQSSLLRLLCREQRERVLIKIESNILFADNAKTNYKK